MTSSTRLISQTLGRAPCSPLRQATTTRILRLRPHPQTQQPSPSPFQPAATNSRSFTTTPFRGKAKTIGQLKARQTTGPFSWKAGALFVLTAAGLVIYFRVEKARLERQRVAEMSKGVGKPKVGGPFTLRDLEGKEFSAEDLKGRYSFVSPIFRSVSGN